MSKKNQIFT